MKEADFLAGRLETTDYTSAAPHHGVAATLGDRVLISAPNRDDPSALPVGINVLNGSGEPEGSLYACPDLHGEASSGHTLAVACATGLLLVDEGAAGPKIRHLAYSGLPEGKSTTLLGGVGLKYWLGNYGADRVVLIDPEEAEPFRLVDLPTRRVHFAVDPVRPRNAYVLTEDGNLHQLDVVSGAIVGTLNATKPYSMDGEWSLPRPRIAVAGDVIAVTDPLAGRVRLIDAVQFTLDSDLDIGGMPFGIIAVGGSGEEH